MHTPAIHNDTIEWAMEELGTALFSLSQLEPASLLDRQVSMSGRVPPWIEANDA